MRSAKTKSAISFFLLLLTIFTPFSLGIAAQAEIVITNAVQRERDILLFVDAVDSYGNADQSLDQDTVSVSFGSIEESPRELIRFAESDEPLAVVFLVNTALSLSSGERSMLDESLHAWIDELRPMDMAAVISYGEKFEIKSEFTNNIENIKLAISQLGFNATKSFSYDALLFTIRLIEQSAFRLSDKVVIVAFTDCTDDGSLKATPEEIEKILTAQGVPLYVVGYGNSAPGSDINQLSAVARKTNGKLVRAYPKDVAGDNIDQAIDQLRGRVMNSYLLTFSIDDQSQTGQYLVPVNVRELIGEGSATREITIDPALFPTPVPPPLPPPSEAEAPNPYEITETDESLEAHEPEPVPPESFFGVVTSFFNQAVSAVSGGLTLEELLSKREGVMLVAVGTLSFVLLIILIILLISSRKRKKKAAARAPQPQQQPSQPQPQPKQYQSQLQQPQQYQSQLPQPQQFQNQMLPQQYPNQSPAYPTASVGQAAQPRGNEYDQTLYAPPTHNVPTEYDRTVAVPFTPKVNVTFQIAGPMGSSECAFAVSGPFVIGRASGCDLQLKDASVSQRHARIDLIQNGGLMIRDLGSTNCVYINGAKVVGEQRLSSGDSIRFGNVNLRVAFKETT